METEELPTKGDRKGQLRYYLKASLYEYQQYGYKRAWRRFWVSRWFWSAGRIGVTPKGYKNDYWS